MPRIRFYACLFILISLLSLGYAIDNLDDILIGGIYKMELLSGDVLEGIVEFKTDTSITIDCQGQPYFFNGTLIARYTLISPPKAKVEKKKGGATEYTFKELVYHANSVDTILVSITNGTQFKGTISAIDSETVQLNVKGSVVPISRDIITKIVKHVPKRPKIEKKKPEIPKGPYDTIVVKNPQTGEYGEILPPISYIGKITKEGPNMITLKTLNNLTKEINRTTIVQIFKHSEVTYDQKIKAYAKSLFCRKNMVLVDVPPGVYDRPFFKICIDKYEYPNVMGEVPKGNISFKNAQYICKKQGKRLCTADEWQWSCSGLEGYSYPYGYNLEKENCNESGIKRPEPSGKRYKCVGKFGVYDMVGNIFEWVIGENGEPVLMGGPLAKCQTRYPGLSGNAKPQTGVRCCSSN
jgi:hypothetical protein